MKTTTRSAIATALQLPNAACRRHADSRQAAVAAVLVGEIAAERSAVRTGELEAGQGIAQRPVGECRSSAASGVEGIDQASEIEGFHLLVTQRIDPAGIEVSHGLGDHLQTEHAADGGVRACGIPVLEGDLVTTPDRHDEVAIRLAER